MLNSDLFTIEVPAIVEVISSRKVRDPWYVIVADCIRTISRNFASAGTFHLLNDLSILVGLI